MFIAYLVVTIVTIVANAAVAIGDFLHAESTLKTSAEVGVPRKWLRPLGALKAAGAGGLLSDSSASRGSASPPPPV